ncbi:ketimine reductase mu-crystallin-like [Episyrphus balteatus]|uniref:ketimine reductase mu-crystallin-like n=1 Tax=Episyrphus balteatus TaxID=286459 RepID=UPI0024860572|nr:ketimine reductase mu-crystallin-like [Episyrphus balteatus]
MTSPVFISYNEVKNILTSSMIKESVEEAFKSVVVSKGNNQDHPYAYQCPRIRTSSHNVNGILLTMPGCISNHKVTLPNGERKTFETLACKLITRSPKNNQLTPQLPNVLANILLFDEQTGQLKCVMDGKYITVWRTVAASLVATKFLYFGRKNVNASNGVTLAIVGCGVQGESHALEMFRVFSTIRECVSNADIIVTCTRTVEPILHLNMLKKDVHINAVGAAPGGKHYCELGQDIYDIAPVYVDSLNGAKTDLADLKTNIVCAVGEVILGVGKCPEKGISVFQSLGMAVEDAAVAQAVFQYRKNKQTKSRL